MSAFRPDEALAGKLDAADPLAALRAGFIFPRASDGGPVRYFCGNSLGLQPAGARAAVEDELDAWASLAVRGHFKAEHPWYRYHEAFRAPLGRLVGAREHEVVAMNSLTANLHLLMVSFYRPTRERFRILVDGPLFPSDLYAVKTQLRHHGLDPDDALVQVNPRPGEEWLREEDVERAFAEGGGSIALALLAGVNFLTGQLLDIARLTRAGQAAGAVVGWDLAHAAGNVPLSLHDDNADFAVWCSYKYLNGGPGALGGAFVHERHAKNVDLPRFGGWWGNDPDTRFRMQLESEFAPVPSADGWQLSNPSVFSLAPLRASLELFDRAGVTALRAKSVQLTAYLEYLLRETAAERVTILTPSDPDARGAQLSLRVAGGRAVQRDLEAKGFVCDFREPNVIRAAPVPLYNSYADVWALTRVLAGKD